MVDYHIVVLLHTMQIFEYMIVHLGFCFLVDVLNGYNGTIFAYGQTSSGKTHTMEVRYRKGGNQ